MPMSAGAKTGHIMFACTRGAFRLYHVRAREVHCSTSMEVAANGRQNGLVGYAGYE